MNKTLKKILAVLLTVTTLLSQVSCGSASGSSLTMGQWLSMIADSFGMVNYSDETPYFKNVDKNDPYFGAFQAAVEWDIIPAGSTVSSNTKVTWKDALVSLVNAAELADEKKSDDEKFELAVHLFDSSIRNYWAKRNIPADKAVKYLEQATTLWATKTYDTPFEKIALSEKVDNHLEEKVDYELQELSQNYPEMKPGEEVVIIPLEQKNSDVDFSSLVPGDVYTLPATDSANASINKVKSVEIKDGNVVIVNDSNFTQDEAMEYIEELVIQETTEPDFTKVGGIYDEYGNPVSIEASSGNNPFNFKENAKSLLPSRIASSGLYDNIARQCKFIDGMNASVTFKVKGKDGLDWSIKLTGTTKSVSLEISKEMKKITSRYKEKKYEAFGKVTFSDIKFTKDIDYSWGTLHSASLRLDYCTTFEGGFKATRTDNIGRPLTKEQLGGQNVANVINEYKTAITDVFKDVNKQYAKEEIYICRIHLLGNSLASVDFIIKGKVEVSGEIKLVIEIEGSSGVEYKKKNMRYIKESHRDINFVADAKIEATIGPGFAVNILKHLIVAEATIDLGAGFSLECVMNIIDSRSHKLGEVKGKLDGESARDFTLTNCVVPALSILEYAEENGMTDSTLKGDEEIEIMPGFCFIWKLYPIVRIGLSDGILKAICDKLSLKVSIEVVGSKNVCLQGHYDYCPALHMTTNILEALKADNALTAIKELMGIDHKCSFDFVPFEAYTAVNESLDAKESETAQPESDYDGVYWGTQIILSSSKMIIKVGETQVLELQELPDGYKTSDLIIEASNYEYIDSSGKTKKVPAGDVIDFDLGRGSVKGLQPGQIIITVKTKDEKHFAACSIWVTE